MPNETSPTSQPPFPAAIICSGSARQRDPRVIRGYADEDVDNCLSTYDHISRHNNWDDAIKLATLVFYLEDVAFQWFRNHEAALVTWVLFKTAFAEASGQLVVRKLRVERLRARAQHSGETFTCLIEDAVDLCSRVNLSRCPRRSKFATS